MELAGLRLKNLEASGDTKIIPSIVRPKHWKTFNRSPSHTFDRTELIQLSKRPEFKFKFKFKFKHLMGR